MTWQTDRMVNRQTERERQTDKQTDVQREQQNLAVMSWLEWLNDLSQETDSDSRVNVSVMTSWHVSVMTSWRLTEWHHVHVLLLLLFVTTTTNITWRHTTTTTNTTTTFYPLLFPSPSPSLSRPPLLSLPFPLEVCPLKSS